MAAARGVLSRFVAAVDGAFLAAPNNDAGEGSAGDWPEGNNCDRLRSAFASLEALGPTIDFTAVALELELVPRSARLVQRIFDSYAAAKATSSATGRDPGGGSGNGGGGSGGPQPLLPALRLVAMPMATLCRCGVVVANGNVRGCDRGEYERLSPSVRRLAEQMYGMAALRAVAGCAALAAEAWPAAAAAVARQPPPRGRGGAGSAAGPLHTVSRAAGLLQQAVMCLSTSLVSWRAARGGGDASVAARRQLTALKASGALSAVCAAMLAAPLGPGVSYDAAGMDEPSLVALDTQQLVLAVLKEIVCHRGATPALVHDLLNDSHVQRVRWGALDQLAALATDEAAPAAAHTAAATATAGARPPPGRWPLLNRRAVQLVNDSNYKGRMTMATVFHQVIEVAIGTTFTDPSFRLSPPGTPGGGGGAAPPTRQRLAELAAPISRMLCAELEVALDATQQLPAPPARRPANPVLWDEGPRRQVAELITSANSLAIALYNSLNGAAYSNMFALLPDLLEMYGWVLCGWVGALSVPGALEPGNPATERAAAEDLLNRVADLIKEWAKYPAAVQEGIARRLLPTGLMRSLDVLLRWELADSGGAPRGAVLQSASTITTYLLVPTMRARLSSCASGVPLPLRHKAQRGATQHGAATAAATAAASDGGGGGPLWHPQDELGLLVTFIQLMRRESAAAAKLVVTGSAVGSAAQQQELTVMLAVVLNCVLAGVQGPKKLPGLATIVAALPPQQQHGGATAATAGQQPSSTERVRVAVLEAVIMLGRTLLGFLESYSDTLAAELSVLDLSSRGLPPDEAGRVARLVRTVSAVLSTSLTSMPVPELLAAEPQRVLAAVARLLAAPSVGGSGSAARGSMAEAVAAEFPKVAAAAAVALLVLAAEEQLAGAVGGWLTDGGGGGGGSGGSAALLSAAIARWQPSMAALVPNLAAAAAAGILASVAKRSQVVLPDTPAEAYTGGGLGGAPLWPPRVLRLCGNPGCAALGTMVEAEKKLLQCSGCRVLRYCCQECQTAHWRLGHRAECAAVAAAGRPGAAAAVAAVAAAAGRPGAVAAASAAATAAAAPAPALGGEGVAVPGGAGPQAAGGTAAPAAAADGGAGGGDGSGGGGGPWSLESLLAMRPRELRAILAARGIDSSDCVEKGDLAARVLERCGS